MGTIDIIIQYQEAFYTGLLVTVQLCAITWLAGLVLGTLFGAAASLAPLWIGLPLRLIAIVLVGVPFLVLLYWANYPLQELLAVIIDPFYTAAGLLCVINIVLVAEIWRGAFVDFPREYVTAAMVTGMTRSEITRVIQIPILLRQVLPGIIAAQVAVLQLTLFSSLISVQELFRVSQAVNAEIQKPIEIYTALAIFFFFLTTPVYGLAWYLRKRFTRDLSES